jgi:hypothetical protein
MEQTPQDRTIEVIELTVDSKISKNQRDQAKIIQDFHHYFRNPS